MNLINNWQVAPAPVTPHLLRLTVENEVIHLTPDQARRIADALYRVANGIDLSVNCCPRKEPA